MATKSTATATKTKELRLSAWLKIERACNHAGSAHARLADLLRECERHERDHRRFCRGRTGYRMSVADTARMFALRAIVTASPRPPRTWPELDVRSDFLIGPVIAAYLRPSLGKSLGLTREERAAVESFDYVAEVAPRESL